MTNELKHAVQDVLDSNLSIDEAINRHFAATFRQRFNGQWIDRAGFSARIAAMRKLALRFTYMVLDELVDGACYAEHHSIELVQHDAEPIVQEVYVFAERDLHGRFVRIEEVTTLV